MANKVFLLLLLLILPLLLLLLQKTIPQKSTACSQRVDRRAGVDHPRIPRLGKHGDKRALKGSLKGLIGSD